MISVIVPIYNVEKYLPAALSSITTQTYTQLEILLIDDGSTDGCYSICEEWSKRDNRIRVFHIPNGGLSAARNYGLQHANGEYISFVDSDDLLHPNMYQLMHQAMVENDADLVICHEIAFPDSQVPIIHPIETYSISEVTNGISTFQHFLDDFTGYVGWAWNKLYARSLLKGISFPSGKYLENIYFNLDVSLNTKKCIWINERLYLYRQRLGSIMKTTSAKKYIDYSEALVYQLEKASTLGNHSIFIRHFEYVVNKLLQLYAQAYSDNQKEAAKYILLRYKDVLRQYPDNKPKLSTVLKLLLKRFFPLVYVKRLDKYCNP